MNFFKRRDVEVVRDPEPYFSVAGNKMPRTPKPTGRPEVDFTILPPEAQPRAAPPAAPFAPHRHAPNLTTPTPPWVTPRPVREPREAPPPVVSGWARRAPRPDVGPDHVRGMCSGCGTAVSVARAPRPMRISCPECGRSRVLN